MSFVISFVSFGNVTTQNYMFNCAQCTRTETAIKTQTVAYSFIDHLIY